VAGSADGLSMAQEPAGDGEVTIGVASSSRDTRRLVGPLAWVALEELALRAVAGNGGLAVETSVRDLAASLGAGKDAVAAALSRLAKLGLVRCQTQRAVGRYAGSAYLLDVDACRRAGWSCALRRGRPHRVPSHRVRFRRVR
jgi:hypothetical protein